jgi:hypothetical protein
LTVGLTVHLLLIAVATLHCTDQLYLEGTGLTGPQKTAVTCSNRGGCHLDTPNIFSEVFHYDLDTLTANWTPWMWFGLYP